MKTLSDDQVRQAVMAMIGWHVRTITTSETQITLRQIIEEPDEESPIPYRPTKAAYSKSEEEEDGYDIAFQTKQEYKAELKKISKQLGEVIAERDELAAEVKRSTERIKSLERRVLSAVEALKGQ
jgi:peptidoglycan hydrolase CwlO-like protein